MNADRLAIAVEFVTAVSVVLALGVPFVAVPGTGLQTYYSWWVLGPLSIGTLSCLVVLAIALRVLRILSRETFAGLTIGLGFAILLLALTWTMNVPHVAVMGVPTIRAMEFHRWMVFLFSVPLFGAAVWYARSITGAPPGD